MKVESCSRFETVGGEAWQSLLSRMALPSPFLSWSWQTTWFQAFGDGRALHLMQVVTAGGELAGLLPLYERRPGVLAIVGGVEISDYLDVLAPAGEEEDVWSALLQTSTLTWMLRGIRAASPSLTLVPALATAYGRRTTVTMEYRCPVLELPPSWDEYLARLTSKDRHELLRKTRRFDREIPGAALACYTDAAEIDAHIPAFFDLHRRSRIGKSRFMDTRMEAFFRAALGALARDGQARLWFLSARDRPLAAYVCLEWAGAVGLYNSGFDPEMAGVAPGIVLLGRIIRDAIARGIRRFDFLRGEERYKYAFGPAPEDLHAIEVTA